MINLYKKDETTFEHNGLGSLDKNILNPEVSWKDNGAFTLEFKYPLFSKHGFEIENSSIIRANDPEGSNLFFVYKITPSMGYVTVLCYQISYKLAFNSINDTNIVNKNGQNALTQMSNATQYPHSFVFSSDIQTTATSRVVRKNPIEFLLDTSLDNSFINRWGGHIVRHNFNIAMNSAYGSNKGYTIRHKKDLKGYEAEFDESTVITRIRPVGADGLLLPELFVDSHLIDNYVEPRIQEIEYSNVKVKTKDSDEEGFLTKELAYAELRRLANLEFSKNKVDQPDFSAKVEFVNLNDTQEYKDLKSLKQILAGDIVKVIHSEDNFSIEAQMVEYKWNPLNQSYISITLGNYTKSFTSTVGKSLQTNLSQVAQQAQSAMNTANGKNTVYSLTYKPSITNSSVEGDLLYLKNGDKTELWILKLVDGKLQWVLQVSDATQEELKAQMAQAKTDIDEAVDSANSAVDKANASVTAVQANTQLINDVNAIANNAKTQAQTANTNANKAINDAGKLSESVLALDTIANQAKSDADTALINANKGITDAKTALNKAIGVDTRVTTEITNVNNTLATKANSTTVDALSKTVSSQGTAISQNATDIKLKADSTVVNAIKGTVDSQGTLISQNSKDIALKANKSSVDTLTGRVSANETAIDITAQGVSTLVTKTDGTNTSLSQFKQDYEGFKGTVYSKTQTDTKISTVQSTVDNFKTTVSSTYSSKAETDSKVTAIQANINKIGKYTAYAYSADGIDGFTTVYPNLNLLDGTSKQVVQANDWNMQVADIKYDKSLGGDLCASVMINNADHASDLYQGSARIILQTFDKSGNVLATTNGNEVSYNANGLSHCTISINDNVASIKAIIFTNNMWKNAFYSRLKIEKGSIATPWMPSSSEVTTDDYPSYRGEYSDISSEQSTNPSDYTWIPARGSSSYTAWSYSADGIDGFTTVYPNLNLLDGTKDFSGDWWAHENWENDGTYKGLTVRKKVGSWGGITKQFTAQKDGVYTFSAYIKSSGDSANVQRLVSLNDKQLGDKLKWIGNNFDWLRDSFQITLKASDRIYTQYNATGTGILWTAGHKWEEGSTATPYMKSASEVIADDYPSYRGEYSDISSTASTDPSKYSWSPARGNSSYSAYSWSDDGTDGFTTVYPNSNLLVNSSAKTKDGFFKDFDKVENGYGEVTLRGNNGWDGRSLWDGFSIHPRDYKPNDKYTISMDIMFTSWNFPAGTYLDEFWMGQRYAWGSWKHICLIDLPRDPSKMLNQWIRITNTSTIPPYEDPAVNTETMISTIFRGQSEASFTMRVRKPKQEPGETATPYMPSEKELTSNDIPKYVGYSARRSENPKDFSWKPYDGSNSYKIIEATTAIEQNSKEISLKANKTEVDTLTGRVSETESSLKIQDGKITALNTKSDGHTTQIGTLESSYNGFKTTVANTYADKNSVASQINQSATDVTSNVQSWANNKLTAYSTTQQTATSITNAVVGKADKTQITQLSDMINLRVSKGDVTSQINIEAGRTLIDTKQLLLNADTVKFSGSAFIPNSVIENLSADKITAGTLNATNVNVINLNAKSLTAGTISGNNLSLNLDTGAVQFTKGYIAGNNNKIRFDLDNSYLHSINPNGSGFKISDGQFSFFDGLLSSTPQYLGAIMLDFFSTDKSGIKVYGNKGASIQGGNSTISVGYSLLGNNKIGLSGDTGVTGGLSVLGKLSVLGSKNAIHVTRDGIRATPAYETAESYLGDIGGNYTRENCEVWVDIEKLFSDTVNTDIAYHVFLQAYDDARFWVAEFKSDKFLIKSDKPMARFAWEIKAKRRGYENDRLVVQEGFDNKMLDKVHNEGAFKGDSENE